MNIRLKKRMLVLSTTLLLFMQPLSMPISMVYAVDHASSIENPNDLEHLDEDEEKTPIIVSFENTQKKQVADELFTLHFSVNREITEVTINIPREATIVTDELASGITLHRTEMENQWIVRSDVPLDKFSLPFVFTAVGKYELMIADTKMAIDIQSEADEQTIEEIPIEAEEEVGSIEDDQADLKTSESLQEDLERSSESLRDTQDSSIQDVANWEEFIRAFVNPTVTTINVVADFQTPNNPRLNLTDVTAGGTSNVSGGITFVYLTVANISRSLTIEGNGHEIDFRAVTLCFNNVTASLANPWNLTLKDLEIYHGNYYGPITFNDLNITNQTASEITYHNITNYGNQLIHSPYSSIKFSGKSSSKQVAEYTSSFNSWRINALDQTNIFASNLTIMEDAEVELETISAGNLDLGGVVHPNNNFKMEKNSSLNAISNGNAGEADGTSLLVRRGSVEIDEGATMTLQPQNLRSAISLRTANSTLSIKEQGSLTIDSKGTKSNFNGNIYNIIWMAAGSKLLVENGGTLSISATEMGASLSNIIHVAGNAQVSIGKDATLDIKSDSTSNNQSLMYFASGGSTFEFSDAQEVNLERTGIIAGTSTANGLINIAGSNGLLDIDVQSVKQWGRGNFGETPDHSWTPIFNLNLRYTGVVPRIESSSSISQETIDSFRANFTTQNVQRVLFEKIPDVQVSIDPLTEDPNETNSYTVTGKATPHSLVRLAGDPAIPEGEIPSPNLSEEAFYHVAADENGDYYYEIPEGLHFTAGNTVTAYAFLNGKDDTASTIVEERKKMPPVDPLDPGIEVVPENMPILPENQGQLSIDFISSFHFGSQAISVHSQTYYARPQRLLSGDGTVNETEERPNYVQISDRRPANIRDGWELAVTQKSQFKGAEDQELIGASLSLSNQQVITAQGGTEPELQSVRELIPGNRRTLLKAQGNQGTGTWIYRFGDGDTAGKSVALHVPQGTNPDATTYSTTLVWELSAVPSN